VQSTDQHTGLNHGVNPDSDSTDSRGQFMRLVDGLLHDGFVRTRPPVSDMRRRTGNGIWFKHLDGRQAVIQAGVATFAKDGWLSGLIA